MTMRRILAVLMLLGAPSAALGQDPTSVRTTGGFSTGFFQLDNSTNSSKLTEYRDLRDDLYVFSWRLGTLQESGLFANLKGTNTGRSDQRFGLSAGKLGLWQLDVAWEEIPHLFSNKAQSVYTERSPGVLEAPQSMVIPFKKLATVSGDAPGVVASDNVIGAYAKAFSRPVPLGIQSRTGTFGLRYDGIEKTRFSAQYTRRTRTGTRLGYGPIGDRPPRTLNIELAEPVDHRTGDLRLGAAYDGGSYQLRAEYLLSDFANGVDDLLWQNVYVTPAAGATFENWDRSISAWGRRPLAPDNRYHNGTLTGGVTLPRSSRLTASLSYGLMRQDVTLQPYSYHANALANSTLPRTSAEAEMTTLHFSGEYSIVPAPRLNLRAFFRHFQLENETPESQWQYVTQDVSNTNGTVSFKNKRVNLAYAWDRQQYGLDTAWRLGFWGSTVGLGMERETIGREYREAGTTENIVRLSWKARPAPWLSLRTRYLHGQRDGDAYDGKVTRQSYWYAPADAGTDNDNPGFTFSNHPDMRRYDVSDRTRDRLDLTASVTPAAALTFSANFGLKRDDFDADVASIQPLADTNLAERNAATPGDQLGWLKSEQTHMGGDMFWALNERVSLNAFLGLDRGESGQRSLEYNENNKQNPSAINTAELGPWTRATSQWTADFEDRNRFLGVGATLDFPPVGASLSLSYTLSLSSIDIDYRGFGVTNWDGTPYPPNHQFAFSSPPTIKNNSHVADVRLELPLKGKAWLVLGYTFDDYEVEDYQQGSTHPWVEPVVSELLLRDTSRSFQWGNRLFNLGRYLAPGYTAHMGYTSLAYRF
jgi:MtrB/PioB family decaheme-associated outer membrane protein